MTMDQSAISHGVATDVGRVRQHNEDSVRVAGTIFVVADGMGGHAAGEVASGIATDAADGTGRAAGPAGPRHRRAGR